MKPEICNIIKGELRRKLDDYKKQNHVFLVWGKECAA